MRRREDRPGRGRRRAASPVVLGHVNLEVTSLARARRFYDRFLPVLGFVRIPHTGRAWLGYRSGGFALWVTVSRRRTAVRRTPHVPTDDATDPISDHLGFRVASAGRVAELEAALRRRGFRPVYPTERQPTGGSRWYTSNAWSDPDHNVLELYAVTRRRAS